VRTLDGIPIITFAGPLARAGAVAHMLREEGLTVDFDHPAESRSGSSGLSVVILAVKGSLGTGVATSAVTAELLRPIVERIKDRTPPVCALLAVSERQAKRITWLHDSDECVAELGEPLRWRAVRPKRGRPGGWRIGRTVWFMEPGTPCWKVTLDVYERSDGWENPFLCRSDVEVEWFENA
jgi:hypothetical protein